MKAILGIVVALLLGACTDADQSSTSADCCVEAAARGPISESSLYQLESSWRDQQGSGRKLSDGRGRVQVVAMIFTRCG